MRIRTEIDESFACCGMWPKNFITDLNTVKTTMSRKGFVGTPITMILHDSVNRLFYKLIEGTDTSYRQYLSTNKLIDDVVVLKFNEINLKKDSVLFITHEISINNYPELELGVCVVEATDLYGDERYV